MNLMEQAIDRYTSRRARVGVLGLGYAGLPLAFTFAEAGFTTCGFDVDPDKIAQLRRGESYIPHIPAERVRTVVNKGTLIPCAGFSQLETCDAAIICVPTPLGEGRTPDLSYVVNTAKSVKQHLHRGQLVVLESTTYPGTTQEVLLTLFEQSGLRVGEDYFLAFSPEREDPANPHFNTRTIPKVVGGITPACLKVATAAYGAVVDRVVPVSSASVAEAVKLLENIYRCVNIALVNELKLLFERMKIDVWEVIAGATTKPFGFTPFYPGPGLGGHCIPVDPFYLSWKAQQFDFAARFIELAGEINTAMPEHVVQRLVDGLNVKGKPLMDTDIILLGVAYKRDIDDVRESPALKIIEILEKKLARVSYHDPYVPRLRSRHIAHEMSSIDLSPERLHQADAVMIVTDHSAIDYGMVVANAQLVVDTRNVTAPYRQGRNNIISA